MTCSIFLQGFYFNFRQLEAPSAYETPAGTPNMGLGSPLEVLYSVKRLTFYSNVRQLKAPSALLLACDPESKKDR